MASARDEILDWSEQGRVATGKLRAALEVGGALPTADQWRGFLDQLLLYMGAVLLGAGVIFFFAFNWQDLGRYAKFGLVQAPILVALAFAWTFGLERAAGKAALLAAALFVGALLALVGQTYQTGADTWELFTAWAAAILPWVLLARFPALWIFWLLIANVALTLYFTTFGFWGALFAPEKLLWVLFGLNTVALAIWEGLAAAGIDWLRERWSLRILAFASGGMATALAVLHIVDWVRGITWGVPAWLAWMAVAYGTYRHWTRDLFVLAGGVLSLTVVTATFLGKQMRFDSAGSLLFIGLVVIGISAAGGFWLKQVANEEERT
ncbi:MAG: DUF2157 domain-containing protein [Betaproteobacteria bacterium]